MNVYTYSEARQKLAGETGIPLATIVELVKLSDLARIWGVGPVFARIIYDSGVDTVALVAEQEALAFRQEIQRLKQKLGQK